MLTITIYNNLVKFFGEFDSLTLNKYAIIKITSKIIKPIFDE